MKLLKVNAFSKKIIIATILMIATMTVWTESLKIAYIDTDRIMAESKDTQEAQKTFANEQQNWQTQIADLNAQIEKLKTEYETKKMVLTEDGKKEAEDKIKELETERDNLIQEIYGENGKAIQRNAELLQPIMAKLKTVIEKVAVENNYSLILDASGGAILYAKPSLDITDMVIDELNKTVE
jgi:outer membrane protein